MIELATFILFAFGITYGISRSTLFTVVRVFLGRIALLRMFIYCAYCTSFWVGAGLALVGIYPMRYESWWMCVIEGAFVAVGSVAIFGKSLAHGMTWEEERDALDTPPMGDQH